MAGGNGGGAQLGTAYFELIPSMRGAGEAIRSQLDPEASSAGTRVGTSMGGKLVGGIGSAISGSATAVVGAASGALGAALTKGFGRLDAIDQAQAKLKGLGHDTADVSTIMGNALASVKGTAFGLGDAATVAAGSVAAGIKPGTELTGVLKTIADTATIAGASMGDTGAIFNSVAARGKLQGDDLMQLQSRGVPVLQFLAKHYDITAQAASEMVSKGTVDFNSFQAAMQEGLGGAALSSGTTFQGAMANVGASLSRIGAGLEGGIFPKLAPLFSALSVAMGPLETQAKAVGVAIGNTLGPWLDKLTGWLNASAAGGTSLFSHLQPLMGIIGPLGAAFAALGAGGIGKLLGVIPGLGGLAGPLSALSGPIGLIVAALGGLIATSPPLQAAIGNLVSMLGGTLQHLFTALQPAISTVVAAISQVATVLGGELGSILVAITPSLNHLVLIFGGVLAQLLPVVSTILTAVAGAFAQIANAVIPLIPVLLGALLPVFSAIIGAVLPLIPVLLNALLPIFNALIAAIQPLLPVVAQLVEMLLGKLLGVVMQLQPLFMLLANVIVQILGAILPLIPTLMQLVMAILSLAMGLMPLVGVLLPPIISLLNALLPPILGLIQPLLALLIPVLQFLVTVLTTVITWVAQFITWLVQLAMGNKQAGDTLQTVWKNIMGFFGTIGAFFASLWNGLLSGIFTFVRKVGDFFGSIPKTIGDIFAGAGTWLFNAGRDMINGLLNGAGGLLKNIGSFFLSIVPGWIVEPFKAALGIHSPSRVFYELGVNTVQGYTNALGDGQAAVTTAAASLVSIPSSATSISPALAAGGVPAGASGSAPLVNIEQVVAPDQDPAVSGRIVGSEIARRLIGTV